MLCIYWWLVITPRSSYLRYRQDSALWATVSLQSCALVLESKIHQMLDMSDGPVSDHGNDDDDGGGDGACQIRPCLDEFRARFAE